MRAEPIYPHKFGRGIPNPVGPATFRGLQHGGRVEKMPETWGPLVSRKLDYSTNTASFSQHQLRDIKAATLLTSDEGIRREREELVKKSQDQVVGWAHTKEYKKKQALMKLMKQENVKKEKVEAMSREEMEIDLERKNKIIKETEDILKFSTERYKEIHSGMLLSEVLKERDIAMKIKQEKDALQEKLEKEEDLKYLENIKKKIEEDKMKKIKRKDFENEWALKRQEQVNEKKIQKEKEFAEEVAEVNKKIEIMKDEIKRERNLQDVERLERDETFKLRQRDIELKLEKARRDREEDEAAWAKMYEIQGEQEERKMLHQTHFKDRQGRIAERQTRAEERYGLARSLEEKKAAEEREEKLRKYNQDLELKLFQESLAVEERENRKRIEKNNWYVQAEKEKEERKLKEKEEMLAVREKNAAQVRDVHEELKKKKDASEMAQRKLNKFWANQSKELEEKRRNKITEDKLRLSNTLKRYNEEDDQLESYVENLLLEEKSKDLNVYPIMKAKQLLSLGRGVPLIAADNSGIRLNPLTKNIFYRPEDSRERLSVTWNVPDKKPVTVNVNTKSQGTMQAAIYRVDKIPIEDQ